MKKTLEFQKKVETFECSSFERRENEQWAFRSLHSAAEIFGNKNSISICHIEKIWAGAFAYCLPMHVYSYLQPVVVLGKKFFSVSQEQKQTN